MSKIEVEMIGNKYWELVLKYMYESMSCCAKEKLLYNRICELRKFYLEELKDK